MKKFSSILAVSVFLASCASTPSRIMLSPMAEGVDEQKDFDVCVEETKNVKAGGPTGTPYSDPKYGSAGAMGAALGAGFARGLADGKARADALNACMVAKGYSIIDMSEEEKSEYSKLKTKDERKAFFEKMRAKHMPAVK